MKRAKKDIDLCHRITLRKRIVWLRDHKVNVPDNCTAYEAKRLRKAYLTASLYTAKLTIQEWGENWNFVDLDSIQQLFISNPEMLKRIFKLMKTEPKELTKDDDYCQVKRILAPLIEKKRVEFAAIKEERDRLYGWKSKTLWQKFKFIFGFE